MESRTKNVVGSFKDLASIGIAKLNSKNPEIDTAVVKATLHNDIPPKEKHARVAVAATKTSAGVRGDLKHLVERRLVRTKRWIVALKTLALIHRLIRDGFPFFTQDELQNPSHITLLAEISQRFGDRSSPLALECSLWIRKYSCYLAQRLHCNRILDYDIVSHENRNNRTKDFEIGGLCKYLPSLQLLLDCLLDCTPRQGCGATNPLIQYALDLILKECPNIYAAINFCIRKLADSFSGVPKDKAPGFVEIYKRNLQQYERLSKFYDACSRVVLTNGHGDFSSLDKPPVSFYGEMKME
jgi:hypothetical protein